MGTFDNGSGSWAHQDPFADDVDPGQRIDDQIRVLRDKVERGGRRQDQTQADVILIRERASDLSGHVATGLSDLLKLVQQETQYRAAESRQFSELIRALTDRVIKLEGGTVPPVDPPTVPAGIYIADGPDGFRSFMLEGKVLRQSSTNVAGYGLKSPRDEIKRFLDQLRALGLRVVRFLHPARDIADGIDDFKPTWDECLKGYDTDLNFWMDELAQRGMFAHLTCFHRQRLTSAEADKLQTPGLKAFLFGPRPAGIVPGEISDTVFVFPELLEIVRDKYCAEIAKRYGNHPALGMVNPFNEIWMTRARGFYPKGERADPITGIRPDGQKHTAYGVGWFAILDEYMRREGLVPGKDDQLMTSSRLCKFSIWHGRRIFRGVRNALRASGVRETVPIGTAAAYGHQRIASLGEAAVGDYVDVHRYPESDKEPDPFSPGDFLTDPSFASYIASWSLADVPLISSEWGSVWQSAGTVNVKQTRTARHDGDPERATRQAWQMGAQLLFQYAAAFGPIPRTVANASAYDSWSSEEWRKSFTRAQSLPYPSAFVVEDVQLTEADLCGFEVAGKLTLPAVIGTQGWAMKAASTGTRLRLRLPDFPEGF